MMSLIKLAELIIVFFVIRSVVKLLFPAKKQRPPEKKQESRTERFESSSRDISDGDYEDV